MADNFRYRYGPTKPVVQAVADAQAVGLGDMVGLSAGTTVRAEDTSWASAVATPSAPTVAASAATRGTALTNAATGVKVSLNFPWGEGALSAAGSATPTAAFGLQVTLAAIPTPALSWNVYVETAAGSGTYKLQQVTTVSAGIVFVDSYGTGRTPPTAAASGALEVTQYNFAAIFAGVAAQRKAANATNVGTGGGPINRMRVNTGGVFEFDCASASFEVGDLVGPAKQSGNYLESQKVVAVVHASLAVGRVAEKASSVTAVKVEVMSKIMAGGPQT